MLAAFLVVAIALIGFGVYRYRGVAGDRTRLAQLVSEKDAAIGGLEQNLMQIKDENMQLSDSLRTEQKKNDAFAGQIARISGTVNTLDRLSKTDPELLKKYSKVSFLNENYIPSKLTDIPEPYTYPTNGKSLAFHAEALPYLESMIDAAKDDGVDLQIISAYRSFGTQAALKSSYKITYGSGANKFSADQGYSEHQLGTTVDLTTAKTGASFVGFDKTDAYKWLTNNAYRYGFILSYPSGNAYYQYEPWHWRFVGNDLAHRLHQESKHFYDMDQREIDTYLVDIFN